MKMGRVHKTKIINDPVHGFIHISSPLILSLLEHPYVQRLRNIKQLGLTYLVYPGACHNRLQHALGATYLMDKALGTLKNKGHNISPEETEMALAAILLHDIGHGPFSHTLEFSLVEGTNHETVSMLFVRQLNEEFGGVLDSAVEIFAKRYRKRFLNELVSGQLDVDRLDYLRRDSFFSGVVEGMVGIERIISMLDICDDELVVEAKGIYSVENFLISRRLMYWQVYMHKTVLSAENVLLQILRRAKYLTRNGEKLFASPALLYFLNNEADGNAMLRDGEMPERFSRLCDGDVESAATVWISHPDGILSRLCKMLVHRVLPRTELASRPFDEERIEGIRREVKRRLKLSEEDTDYFVTSKTVSNTAYSPDKQQSILIKYNDGTLLDVGEASDMLNHSHLNSATYKYMLSYPKHEE